MITFYSEVPGTHHMSTCGADHCAHCIDFYIEHCRDVPPEDYDGCVDALLLYSLNALVMPPFERRIDGLTD